MCGKFTSMFSYRQVWAQENAFYLATGGDGNPAFISKSIGLIYPIVECRRLGL